MLLDAIISALAAIFIGLSELLGALLAFVANCIIAFVEYVVRFFSPRCELKRVSKPNKPTLSSRKADAVYEPNPRSVIASAIGVLLIFIAIMLSIFLPKVLNKEVELYASDGQAIPLALVIIQTSDGLEENRTDPFGRLSIPRFNTYSITINDPRYAEKTWTDHEINSELFVERSILGKGLDKITRKLLEPKN